MLYILECNETMQMCCNLQPFLKIIKLVISILQWSIPLLLILLCTIDITKAVLSGDEKVITEAQSKAIKRVIYAVIIFVIPILVKTIFNIINNSFFKNDDSVDPTNWIDCWFNTNEELENKCKSCDDIYATDE